MSGRRGFTLLELMVALAVTGIVALLVYGAAAAAMDTEQRLRERASQGRAERAWRAILEAALRNVRSADDYGRPTLRIDSLSRGPGGPVDRLWFITAGALPPLTPDADWEVLVEPVEGGRIGMTATPIGVSVPARRILAPPAVTGLQVQAWSEAGRPGWVEDWGLAVPPRAVALTYWSGGRPLGTTVHLSLPRGPAP